jgi:hypothetical protein
LIIFEPTSFAVCSEMAHTKESACRVDYYRLTNIQNFDGEIRDIVTLNLGFLYDNPLRLLQRSQYLPAEERTACHIDASRKWNTAAARQYVGDAEGHMVLWLTSDVIN